MQIAIKPALFY